MSRQTSVLPSFMVMLPTEESPHSMCRVESPSTVRALRSALAPARVRSELLMLSAPRGVFRPPDTVMPESEKTASSPLYTALAANSTTARLTLLISSSAP